MKKTIRGVDNKLWEEVEVEKERSKFHPPQVSSGDIVNEALRLRYLVKANPKLAKAVDEARSKDARDTAQAGGKK